MKAQHDAQFVVADVFGHQAVNAAPCAHAGKRGNGIDQVANRVEGNRPQTFKAQGFAQLGIGQKVFITDQIVGRKTRNFGTHGGFVTAVIKPSAIAEPDTVKRVHGTQIDIVFEGAATQCPQLFQ